MKADQEEKERITNYYNWEKITKCLKNQIEGILVKDLPMQVLAKSLNNIVLTAKQSGEEGLLDNFNVAIKIDDKPQSLPYANLHKFVIKKSMQTENMGFNFDKIEVKSVGENPYQHPLSKSLGIQPLDENFLATHQIMTKEVYESLEKGVPTENALGTWNLDVSKVVDNIENFDKVRKLVHRNGKTFISTLYAAPLN